MTASAPIVLDVVGIPAPQGSKTSMLRGGHVSTVEGSSDTGRRKLKSWRQAVTAAAREYVGAHSMSPIGEPVRVSVVFRFPPVKSDPYRTLHDTKPDASKVLRSTEDAMVDGGLLVDDARVCSVLVEKRYCVEGESVGATIEVERLGWYEQQQRERRKVEAAELRRAGRRAS